jgi:hypothetical protein
MLLANSNGNDNNNIIQSISTAGSDASSCRNDEHRQSDNCDHPHDDDDDGKNKNNKTKKQRRFRNMHMNTMNHQLQSVNQMIFPSWTGKMDFLKAQAQVAAILVIAAIGNLWPVAYKRNDNHNPTMFWVMNAGLLVVSLYTLKHDKEGSARGVQLLSRPQTEEWKGWMQWAFIMVRVTCNV